MLAACSNDPSDMRASKKVSMDQVPPGSRETDIYNMQGQNSDATPTQHGDHGVQQHEEIRPDVMPNHDEHSNTLQPGQEVPDHEKTNNASQVENHE